MVYRKSSSKITTAALAEKVGGTLVGAGDVEISALCALDEPAVGALTFLKIKSPALITKTLSGSKFGAVLVPKEAQELYNPTFPPLIAVAEPFRVLIDLVPFFYSRVSGNSTISDKAYVHPSAKIGKNVTISAFCSVAEGCEIGDNCYLHPNVVVYCDCRVGPNCEIHAGAILREGTVLSGNSVVQNGAVIGSDGFGYITDKEKGLVTVPQVGTVELGYGVDVGSNTCIDRGAFGTTKIGTGTKIDNLVQVGHNTKVGNHSVLCGMVGLSGSTKIGSQVVLGGGVGVGDHVTISDNIRVGGRSTVFRDLKESGDYAGYPATIFSEWRRQMGALKRLPEIVRQFNHRDQE